MPWSSCIFLVLYVCATILDDAAHAFGPSAKNPLSVCDLINRYHDFEPRKQRFRPSPMFDSASEEGDVPDHDHSHTHTHAHAEKPPPSPAETREKQIEFKRLVDKVMKISQPEHVPRLLANNMELIMGLQGEQGTQIISNILEDAKMEGEKGGGDDAYSQTLQTVEMILSFAEDFVGQALEMDANNKKLLGRIMKVMVKPDNDTSVSGGEGRITDVDDASRREEALDQVMKEEKKHFTSGFLRHIEGECDRISHQKTLTPESTRLLEILRMIQTRVLEELGQDLGEAALVLGQLMGYEKEEELLGVLDAGLTVRGNEFALEMASLTEEALDGFGRVPGGADPELVEKVRFIDRRLQEFLNETNQFQ